jgi:hypothetical protein
MADPATAGLRSRPAGEGDLRTHITYRGEELVSFGGLPVGAPGRSCARAFRNPLEDCLARGEEATTAPQAYTRLKEILGTAETE